MIKIHGPFWLQPQHEKMSDGWPSLRDGEGESWHRYVFNRVRFDTAGGVAEFFEDDGLTRVAPGARLFGHVVANDPNGEMHWVTDDITKGDPIDRFIVETTEKIEVGMRLRDGEILSALPPAYVPIRLPKGTFILRLTEDEYDAFEKSVADGETQRMKSAYTATGDFVEGGDIWNLVVKHLRDLVSAERLAELLARP